MSMAPGRVARARSSHKEDLEEDKRRGQKGRLAVFQLLNNLKQSMRRCQELGIRCNDREIGKRNSEDNAF